MHSPIRALAVVGAALVLMIGGAVAYAAIPSADGTIRACYDSGGALKVIDEGASCAKGWKGPISWNQKGQPGVSGFEVVTERKDQTFSTGPIAGFSDGVVCPEGKVTAGGGGQVTLVLPNGDVETAVIVGSYPIQRRFWTMEFARNGGAGIPAGTKASIFISAHCVTAS
jgi:hypothetical protein